ncbi:HvfC/BufC N-terminal domain-containing protein [Tautonia sociabilis]|nr:DNA-binding domain-containing protein [Tautonia sociabilis]
MIKDSLALDRLQHWMQAVITHPGGVLAGMGAEEARRHIDVDGDRVEEVITRSRALGSVDRLEVYARAYYARLIECLRAEFPVLIRAIGEDLFDEFAVGYLIHYPSRSYTLNRLGAHLARHLDETRPPDEGWAALLVDLAALEWAIGEVYDGPGVEGQRLLDAADLLVVPADRWPEVRLEAAPCLRTLALSHPVGAYYTALRRGEDATPPGPAESFLALTRRDFVVRLHELSRPQYHLLNALMGGQPLGPAIGAAMEADAVAPDRLVADLRRWFHDWAAAGFFRAIASPRRA